MKNYNGVHMSIIYYTVEMKRLLVGFTGNAPVSAVTWEFDSGLENHYKFIKSSAMTEKEAQEIIVFLKTKGLKNINLRCNGVSLLNKEKAYHVDCLHNETDPILIKESERNEHNIFLEDKRKVERELMTLLYDAKKLKINQINKPDVTILNAFVIANASAKPLVPPNNDAKATTINTHMCMSMTSSDVSADLPS